MKSLSRAIVASVAVATFPCVLCAHPGHDDPELTWDLGHLIAHPQATFLCFATLGIGVYLAYRLARWARESPDRE